MTMISYHYFPAWTFLFLWRIMFKPIPTVSWGSSFVVYEGSTILLPGFFRFSLFQDARVRTFYESVFVHMYMPEQQANWIHGQGGRRRRSDKWSPKWAQRWPPPCKPYITSLVFIPAKPSQQTVWGRTRGIPAIGFSHTEMDYRLVQFLKLARPVMDLRGNLWRPTSRTKKQTSFPLPTMKKCSKSWWSR